MDERERAAAEAGGCPFAAAAARSSGPCPITGAAADQPAPEPLAAVHVDPVPAPVAAAPAGPRQGHEHAGGRRHRSLSRRSLLKLGLAAAGPLLYPAGALAATKKKPVPTPTPTATPAATATATPSAATINLGGAPKWGHAVGDPRGTDIAVAVGRAKEGRFGVMFKNLPAFSPPDEALADLAKTMVDPRPPLADVRLSNDGFDNTAMPAGYIYLGQFIDHDMTRDTTPLTAASQDPHAMTNFDTAQFDLGSVYGRGPKLDPQLYDKADPRKMAVTLLPNGLYDLPRAPDGTAYIGDPRNDENLIIAQLHVAFLRLHNIFVDKYKSFLLAQMFTRFHYQWMIVNDFLPRMCGTAVIDSLLPGRKTGATKVMTRFYKPGNRLRPMMPVEYSGAAYRFGHTMIRAEYEVHDGMTAPIFGDAIPGFDLRGSRCLPNFCGIDWNYFFEIPGMSPPDDRNYARMIDTKLSLPLSTLPPTVVAPTADAILSLAERNLLRGKRLGLPAGQDVATAMGLTPLTNEQLGLTDPRFGGKAPLWYYILRESELAGARQIGPVGARIVAEVIIGIMGLRATSYLNAATKFLPATANWTMGALLKYAGVVSPEIAAKMIEIGGPSPVDDSGGVPENPDVPEVPDPVAEPPDTGFEAPDTGVEAAG